MRFYGLVGIITRFFLQLLSDCYVSGAENVPERGALVVVSNHQSNIDPPLLGALVPRWIHFLAKEELFRIPVFGFFCAQWGAFPLRRGGADRQAMRKALEFLRDGEVVGLFPEGHRSRECQMQKAQPGVALIALRSKAPILPVAIVGTRSAVRHLWLRPRIDIIIGQPFQPQVSDDAHDRGRLEEVSDEIMAHIAALLPPEHHGHYRERARIER